jgi:hypothetical protein
MRMLEFVLMEVHNNKPTAADDNCSVVGIDATPASLI